MFALDDEVTVLLNLQCHGKVIESDDKETNVRLNNPSGMSMKFKTSDLKLREKK